MCLPTLLLANEKKYLAGAVPVVDGKVVFSVVFEMPGIDQQTIYEKAYSWLESRMKRNENESQVAFSDKEKGQIVAIGSEYLVFRSNAFLLDRAQMTYNVEVFCSPEKCEILLERIRYIYDEEKFTAEEYITDNVSLNKAKTTIYRGYKKFRVKTIDFADDIFDDAFNTFSGKKTKKEPENTKTTVRTIDSAN